MIRLALDFARDVWARLGSRLVPMLAWLVLSAVLGVVSIAAMLPLLTAAGIGASSGGMAALVGAVGERVQGALGLPAGPGGYAMVVVLVLAANYLFFWLHVRASARLQADYVAGWQSDLFAAILAARWDFFQRHRQGDLINALTGEMSRLNATFYQGSALLAAVVHSTIYIAGALLVSWPVTLAILATGAVLIGLSLPWMRRGARMGYRLTERNAELQSTAGQYLGAAKLVKASATEASAQREFSATAHAIQDLNARVTTDGGTIRALFELVSALLVIAILVGGSWLAGVGAAQIVVVMGLFVRLFPRLSGLQQSAQAMATVIASLAAVRRLHADATAAREPASDAALPFATRAPVAISLDGLTAAAGGQTILGPIDLEIGAGELIAVVGPSGSGKSTMVDCILGLVQPAAGAVRVAGHALGELPLSSWRRAVGYLAQDAAILNATARANVAWGNPGATDAALLRAIEQANAGGLIASLPDGMDTLLGQKGRALSGGERQRIGLARALVGNRCLLILDEATSAQDAESEAAIVEALRALKGRLTIVMVAHRLSSVRIADRVCVLEQGRIVACGAFADLVANPGRFRDMWHAQGADRDGAPSGA